MGPRAPAKGDQFILEITPSAAGTVRLSNPFVLISRHFISLRLVTNLFVDAISELHFKRIALVIRGILYTYSENSRFRILISLLRAQLPSYHYVGSTKDVLIFNPDAV